MPFCRLKHAPSVGTIAVVPLEGRNIPDKEGVLTVLDRRELTGGLLVAATGAAIAIYGAAHYAMGSVVSMGPGMIPVAMGVLLAIFGLIIALGARTAPRTRHSAVKIEAPGVILASVLAFALLISSFGLLPAVAGTVILATLAERPFRPMLSLKLAAGMTVIAWLIFVVAMRLSIPLIKWPF